MEAMAFIRNSEGWNSYFWRKWIPTGNLDGYWGEYSRTPYEFPLIRLGDVILMLAEAYNEAGATDRAVTEVNKFVPESGCRVSTADPHGWPWPAATIWRNAYAASAPSNWQARVIATGTSAAGGC